MSTKSTFLAYSWAGCECDVIVIYDVVEH